MAIVKYEESTLMNARNKMDTYNEHILDAMKKIYEETNTITNILNTPKSNKNITEYLDYLNDRINYVSTKKEAINKKLSTAENIYREEFLYAVGEMVGGNNGN